MRWVVGALGAALVGVAAACGSFSAGEDTPTTTTTPEAGTPEAGTVVEAGGGPLLDASPAVTTRFCDGGVALFCADFDGDPDAGLSNADVGNGKSAIETGVDGGRDLFATLPEGGPGDQAFGFQTVTLPGVGDLHIEADVFFEPIGDFYESSASVNVIEVQFGDNGPTAFAQVGDSPLQQGVFADCNGSGVGIDDNDYVPQNQWVHVVFEAGLIDPGGDQGPLKPGFARVTWNHRETSLDANYPGGSDGALNRSGSAPKSVTVVSFGVGRFVNNQVDFPYWVHIDNVIVTAISP